MQTQLLNFKNLRKAVALFILCLSCVNSFKAQTSPAWVQFASPANYANYDVKEVSIGVDTVGNVYTAASAYDSINDESKSVLVKNNSSGVQQWIKFYDNANLSYNDKQVVSLLVDKAGNSYLCGYGRTNGNAGTIDFIVMKYDNAGTQQWVKTWDGGYNDYDYATCAAFDAAGNIIIGGYIEGGSNGQDMGIVKYSTAGVKIWSYIYNNSAANGEDRPLSIASDASNNIFITGSSYGTNSREMITLKLNSAGANQWTKIMPYGASGGDERGFSIAADALGNSYATGVSGDWITVKYDPSGTVLWTNHYTANTLNQYDYRKVMLDKHGNVIVAGDAYFGSGHSSDLVINKLAGATGASLWSSSINNGGSDSFNDAVLDTSGNVYVGGYFDGPLANDISAAIISSATGFVQWSGTYTNPNKANGGDEAYQVAVDRSRNFYLAGLAERRGSGSVDAVDIVTLKYSALITGIKENALNHINLNIYPNPAKDNLTISFTEQSLIGSTISVSNMIGQLVKSETLNSTTQTVDIHNLPKGLYIVKVANGTTVATGKLVIE